MADDGKRHRRLSLSSLILIGLGLGIACGLFFGEWCAAISVIGDAYVRLLQMTVLPYIVVTLVVNIGGLSFEDAKRLGVRAVLVLVVLWVVGLIFVLLLPIAFPDWISSSFFSTSLIEPPSKPDLLGMYIPANVFNSLSSNLVPAVVLFSIAIGIALIGVERKTGLLDTLSAIERSLANINIFIVKLAPIGVFAIAASALGTMDFAEFGRLQAYVIAYLCGAVILGGWVLPMCVAAVTPLRYRDIVANTRAALLTGFTLNSLFIILPMLSRAARRLLEAQDLNDPDAEATVDVVVPSAFAFPMMGKILVLMFVPFAAWYVGEPMGAGQYPELLGTGLPTFFAGTSVALPLLLDNMELPSDMFQLYLLSSIFTERFGTAVSAMHVLTFTLLTACLMIGGLRVRWWAAGGLLAGTVILLAVVLPVSEAYLSIALRGAYDKNEVIANMQALEDPGPATVHRAAPGPSEAAPPGMTRLEWIRQRGSVRVGYMEDRLPFSYFNARDELAGFDVEMAHVLARELGVAVEFIPIESGRLPEQLENGELDMAMAGIPATTDLLTRVRFSEPYLDVTYALLVSDHRRREFATIDAIRRIEGLRIGVYRLRYFQEFLEEALPDAEIVMLDSYLSFLEQEEEPEESQLDALLTSAEDGSAWSLLYPEYCVVIPRPSVAKLPLAYPIASDEEWRSFLNAWIDLKRKDGTIQEFYDHWILGLTAETGKRRWSVIRDVLHWVK
jgi:Na+/H+-dicarboxylate symporter